MRVLGIGAHPDDLEICCGGTLARFAAGGHQVQMVFICSGNRGSVSIGSDEMRVIRMQEATAAARIIGAEMLPGGFVGDLDLWSRETTVRDRVVEVIREARPDLILTHGHHDYNPDHLATNELVLAAMQVASVPAYETRLPAIAGRVPAYFFEPMGGVGFVPGDYVDITTTYETKMSMWRCHQSQVEFMERHRQTPTSRIISVTAEFRGVQCGVQ